MAAELLSSQKRLMKLLEGMMDRTIDDVAVVVGMRVWDYDLRRAVVGNPQPHGNPAEPTWYDMTTPEGERSAMMDAKRMWVFHPTTGERA